MEQLLIPKTNCPLCADVIESDPEKRSEMLMWQNALDLVAARKISWDSLLLQLKKPLAFQSVARFATSKNGQTMLHLAILADRTEVVQELGKDVRLRGRQNRQGMTPVELAQLLDKKKSLLFLQSEYLPVQPPVPFPKELNLEYLTYPVYEREELLTDILNKTEKAKLNDEIPPEKIWMGVYYDKEIQTGSHSPVAIRHIDAEVGYGVFARKKIAPCSYVGEYTGVIQERKRRHLKGKVYCVRYTVWNMGRRNFVIDAEEKGNFTRFINHSSKPNLGLQSIYWKGVPRMIFIALKEIQEGTQLTFDYGAPFWKESCQIPKLFE